MSREEAMKAFIESGMELRRDDIELGYWSCRFAAAA